MVVRYIYRLIDVMLDYSSMAVWKRECCDNGGRECGEIAYAIECGVLEGKIGVVLSCGRW